MVPLSNIHALAAGQACQGDATGPGVAEWLQVYAPGQGKGAGACRTPTHRRLCGSTSLWVLTPGWGSGAASAKETRKVRVACGMTTV